MFKLIAQGESLKEVGDLYNEGSNKDKDSIVKEFLLYYVKLDVVAKEFRKDILDELWKELIRIRQVAREEEQVIKDHAFDFIGSTLSEENKAILIEACKIELRTKKSLGSLMLEEPDTKEKL